MSTTSCQPDQQAIAAHCAALHQCAEGLNGLLVLAGFGEDPTTGQALHPLVEHFAIGDVEQMTARAMEWTAQCHRNVYSPLVVMPADLPLGRKGEERDILKVLGLVADFDDAEASQWPTRTPTKPTAVLQTSPRRCQLFFLFEHPVDTQTAKDLARRLQVHTRCDFGTKDVCHVWRIAGTLNWPNKKKLDGGRSAEPCVVVEVPGGTDKVIDCAVLDAALPVPPAPINNGIAYRPAPSVEADDQTLLDRMLQAKNGTAIQALWDGDWRAYPSQSEADSALVFHLAFWCSRDASRVDRLFRRSGLMREKWDTRRGDSTYGADTIAHACAQCRETYTKSHSVMTTESSADGPEETPTSPDLQAVEDPEPIALDAMAVPEFPAGSIPAGWLCDMVEAESAATETPVELALLVGLAVTATTLQKKFLIEPEPGYTEPLNLWVCPALDSGCRKSAVVQEMTAPLLEHEKQYAVEHGPRLAQAAAQRRLADERIKHLRQKAAKAEGLDAETLRHELFEAESALTEVPKPLQLWAQDVTPEQLGVVMADHGEKLAILSDEGGLFDILAGRYSKGVPNIDLFLQAHSGSPYRVDRGSRPPVFMKQPALTIALSPQPDVLKGLAKTPCFRGRGLLARFIYALPRSPLGRRTNISQPVPADIRTKYAAHLSALLRQAPRPDEQAHTLRLSVEALREWKAFQNHVEVELRGGGRFEHITDWAGKLPGGCARLAGVLHCATHALGEPDHHLVSLTTMEAALKIGALLEQHALAVFSLMAVDSALDAANKVWSWITRQRQATFSKRGCFHDLQGSFHEMAAIQPAFESLVERGYLFPFTVAPRAGRPSPHYRVNGRIAKEWV